MSSHIKYQYSKLLVRIKSTRLWRFVISYLKTVYENAVRNNSTLRLQTFQFLPFLIASVFCGALAFSYYRLFYYSERASEWLYDKNPYFIFVITPVCFVISWLLCRRYAPFARGSGIPQVMASVELSQPGTNYLVRQFLSLRVIFIKILSSCIKVLGGGVSGREGPTIQIASSIFISVYKILPSWWPHVSQRNIIIAGASSGLAAAFNTPLGGIIFAIEELSKSHIKHYKSPLFIAVIIAGLTAQTLGGSYLYLGYPRINTDFTWLLFVGVIASAALAGYLGAKMCVWMYQIMKKIGSLKSNGKQLTIVVSAALIVSTLVFFFEKDAMGSGKEVMERILFTPNKTVAWHLPITRILGLISSFSVGGAGGIFAPSLSAGATVGAVVAQIMNFADSNANVLIIVGMTSFLTGVTRAPFTSAIIVIEMTDRHSAIFFLMLSAVVANVMANTASKTAFYDHLKEDFIKKVNGNKPLPPENSSGT